MKFKFMTAPDDDPERAVLPTLVYARVLNSRVRVRGLMLGWWKWGVGVVWVAKR